MNFVSLQRDSSNEADEREELHAVFASGIFSKAPNLQHFLEYVGEMYFSGKSDEVKEYSIAVHALKRPESFDPQSDTIVRVTAHSLRKRLEQYYMTDGVHHPLQVQLPPGRYVLRFLRKPEAIAMDPVVHTPGGSVLPDPVDPTANGMAPVTFPALEPSKEALRPRTAAGWRVWVSLGVAVLMCLVAWQIYRGRQNGGPEVAMRTPARATAGGPEPTNPVLAGQGTTQRILFGDEVKPYVDMAGQIWTPATFCKGGTAFSHPAEEIQGTDDPLIFRDGREGPFQCSIPVAAGVYQLQLLFADTAGNKEGARQVVFSINGGAPQGVDVVDDAGGNNIAVGKVYGGIRPSPDGFIHLKFLSEAAFVNAAELSPAPASGEAPLRMIAGPVVYRDQEGNTWQPERFFVGGRRTFHPATLPRVRDAKRLEWERYGHFHYSLPVVPDKEYSVTLFFSEGWFGTANGGPGGVGSRVFDVYCNGTTLLDKFDILREQKGGTGVVTAHHVKPTAHGMLELYFTPVVNYPLVNAIEVDPES